MSSYASARPASAAPTGTPGWGTTPCRSCRGCRGTSSPARSSWSAARSRSGPSATVSPCRSRAGAGAASSAPPATRRSARDQTQPGFTHHGSFADLVALHAADTNLVRLPDDLSFVDAASLGCRFATAYRAVVHQGRTREGEMLAVHGCGGVGLSAVVVGACVGAKRGRRRRVAPSPGDGARPRAPPRSTRQGSRPPRSRPRCATPRAVARTCRWMPSAAPPR